MESLRTAGPFAAPVAGEMRPRAADLFSPIRLGSLDLPNRIVVASMRGHTTGAGNVPSDATAAYYAQRAGAGLIVAEETQVVPQGAGYPATPGMHSTAQIAGWRRVTEAVHAAGGRIFCQLWHAGRISHPSLQPEGGLPVAPSAVRPAGMAVTPTGPQPFVTPRALRVEEIAAVVTQFRRAAANARLAGFDGVEVHAANGYLLDQFLRDRSNRRTDDYGGSVANRARLLLEVVEAVVEEWSGARVGVRLSPTGTFNDMSDSRPARTFSFAARQLAGLDLAYLHIVEPAPTDPVPDGIRPDLPFFRSIWPGCLITNRGYDRARAEAVLADGRADLVSFGSLFVANPDLADRFRRGAPLNPLPEITLES